MLTLGLNLTAGDRVAIASKNQPEYVEIMYGIWWAGLAAVPINAKLHGSEFSYILENSGARVCIVGAELLAEITEYQPNTVEHTIAIKSDEYEALFDHQPATIAKTYDTSLAWLFFTSGTTGRPNWFT